MISTSKVVSPPEIPALKIGKASSVFIGLTFSSATDRDGVALAKFDIKSDRGSTSIEIRPTLGEFMDSSKVTMSQSEFDSKVADLHGIHQRITSTFSLSPMNDDVYTNLPKTILQHLNLVSQLDCNPSVSFRIRPSYIAPSYFIYLLTRNKSERGLVKDASLESYQRVSSMFMLLSSVILSLVVVI